MDISAFIVGVMGMSFGITSFVFAVLTKKRVDKLESELNRLNVLPDEYKSI